MMIMKNKNKKRHVRFPMPLTFVPFKRSPTFGGRTSALPPILSESKVQSFCNTTKMINTP